MAMKQGNHVRVRKTGNFRSGEVGVVAEPADWLPPGGNRVEFKDGGVVYFQDRELWDVEHLVSQYNEYCEYIVGSGMHSDAMYMTFEQYLTTHLLHQKYDIKKTDGTPMDPNAVYFVLRIDTDPAARAALKTYAANVANPEFAQQLKELVEGYE